MNKRDRFKIVVDDELNLESSAIDNIEIVDIPEEVNVDRLDDIEENKIVIENEKTEVEVSNKPEVSNEPYVGFGTRIFVMLVLVIGLFCGAFLLIHQTIEYSKSVKVTYSENAKVNYKVCPVKEDSVCMEEDGVYNSSRIKNINATFDYNIDFEKNIPYELTYHISAITNIYDKENPSKVLYTNNELIVDRTTISDNKSSLNIYKDVTYDYLSDNSYVVSYKDVYSKDYIADVKIVLFLDEEDESREVASITSPLNSKSFEITKSNTFNKNQLLSTSTNGWNKYTLIFAVMASLLIIIALILLMRVTRLVMKVTNNRTKYQQKLMQILREYDRIIVIARDGYETNKARETVKLGSFDELLDIKDNLNKPIIFSKVSEIKCEFIVEDDEKLYKYVLKDEDV